jgi:hypothetical protein
MGAKSSLQSSQPPAASALRAGVAAQIERTAGASPVTVDGAPLAIGDSMRVERAIEIAHSDGTRLQVRPGGGEVAALTTEAKGLRAALRDLLAHLGVPDAAAARTAGLELGAEEAGKGGQRTKKRRRQRDARRNWSRQQKRKREKKSEGERKRRGETRGEERRE